MYSQSRVHDCTTKALDDFVLDQLSGIDRTFKELTERLGDPDVLSNPKLIMEVSQERASVEEVRTHTASLWAGETAKGTRNANLP